jgi:hypothetical protein
MKALSALGVVLPVTAVSPVNKPPVATQEGGGAFSPP